MRFWLWAALLVACAAPAAKSVEPVAPLPIVPFEVSAPSSLDCESRGPRYCVIEVPLNIVNRTSGALVLRSVHATKDALGGDVVWNYEPTPLRPGSTRIATHTGVGPGDWTLEVIADAGGAVVRATTKVRIHNREREQAMAACDACHGTWGSYGMAGTEGCDCTASDAGKICHDQSECQGDCLEPAPDPATHGFVSRCSLHTKTFGCKARVRGGTAHMICVD